MMSLAKKILCTAFCTAALTLPPAMGMMPTMLAAYAAEPTVCVDGTIKGEWEETGDKFTHRFRDSSGKVTEFTFVYEKDIIGGEDLFLYINGEKALRKDVPVNPNTKFERFGLLIDGQIYFLIAICNESSYNPYEETYVENYASDGDNSIYKSDIPIYDPVTKKQLAILDIDADISASGYVVNGKANVSDNSSYKYTIDENGYFSSEIPGPEITSAETDVGEVTISYNNVIIKKGIYRDPDEYKNYAVSYCKKGEDSFTAAPAPKKNKATVTGLEKGAEYTIRITTTTTVDGFKYALGHTDIDVTIPESKLEEGWNTVNGKKLYIRDGKQVFHEVVKIDDKYYCFDTSGALCSSGYYTIDKNKYYVNEDGSVAVNTWIESDHKKMKYVCANSEGVITEYEIKSDSDNELNLYKNGKYASIDDVCSAKMNDVLDDLDIDIFDSIADRAFVMFDGKVYYFAGDELFLQLTKPNKSSGKTGLFFEAASGNCYGKFKFTADKKLTGDKNCLYNGTLSMSDSGFSYKLAADGSASEQKLSAPSKVTSESSASAIKLSWNAVKGVTSYNVYLYDKNTKEYRLYANVKDTSCIVDGLKKSTTYKFRVAGALDVGRNSLEQKSTDLSAKTSSKTLKGFVTKSGSSYYYLNGFKVKNEVVNVKGKYYGFDANGKMIKNKTCKFGNDTYQFTKTGAAVTNQWVYYKTNEKVSYIGKDGKYTTFDFTGAGMDVNGRDAVYDDFKHLGTGVKGVRFGKLYYTLDIKTWMVSDEGTITNSKFDVYDYATGKVVDTMIEGVYLGEFKSGLMDFDVWNNGKMFSTKNNMVYTFKNHEIQSKAKATCPIVINGRGTSLNIVDGCDFTLSFYNNSNKTISSMTLNTSVLNRSGTPVSCTIWGTNSFNLQYTGSVKPNSPANISWDAFMYNGNANSVRINSITVTYTDGTSQTYKNGNFTDLTS